MTVQKKPDDVTSSLPRRPHNIKDGQRLIDLSELIRAYGESSNPVTPDTSPKTSQRYTLGDTQQNMRDDLLLREIQALREQVTQLQDETISSGSGAV